MDRMGVRCEIVGRGRPVDEIHGSCPIYIAPNAWIVEQVPIHLYSAYCKGSYGFHGEIVRSLGKRALDKGLGIGS